MAHEQHERHEFPMAGHEHHHEDVPHVDSLTIIVADLSDTEALVRYDCPCGCAYP